MDESDRWFEEKIQNIEALETQLRKVHSSIELLVSNRKDLALSTGSFAKTAAILSNAEEHTALARALAQLAEVEEKVEQMHHNQANSDFFLFCELLKDYIALIGSVKEVFHERVKAYQNWQHAQQMLNKKREAKAKLELQVRPEKMGQAREDVVEWESKVEQSQEEFNAISGVIKKELEQFEVARVKEFKKCIVKYLESLLSHQHELVKYWEAFLPEAKAIA
jgi:sorting nexin-1/2